MFALVNAVRVRRQSLQLYLIQKLSLNSFIRTLLFLYMLQKIIHTIYQFKKLKKYDQYVKPGNAGPYSCIIGAISINIVELYLTT